MDVLKKSFTEFMFATSDSYKMISNTVMMKEEMFLLYSMTKEMSRNNNSKRTVKSQRQDSSCLVEPNYSKQDKPSSLSESFPKILHRNGDKKVNETIVNQLKRKKRRRKPRKSGPISIVEQKCKLETTTEIDHNWESMNQHHRPKNLTPSRPLNNFSTISTELILEPKQGTFSTFIETLHGYLTRNMKAI